MQQLLDFLGPVRKDLVKMLKDRGGATAQELADATYLSIAATRAHLLVLERAGLITFERRARGVGRPTHYYRLTARGDALFPHGYADLSKKLLGIAHRDPECKSMMVAAMEDSHTECLAPAITASDPGLRAQQLAEALGQRGFSLELEQRGRLAWELRVDHCPLLDVAREFPVLCEIERRTVASAAGSGVSVEHLARQSDGQPRCVAMIRWPIPGLPQASEGGHPGGPLQAGPLERTVRR